MKKNTLATILLILGLISILLYFIYNNKINNNYDNSSMISINESGSINLVDLKSQTDMEGLLNPSKKLSITNIYDKDVTIKLKLEPDKNNTLDITNIRYAIYLNNVQYTVNDLNDGYTLYEGVISKNSKIDLEIFIWLNYLYRGSNEVFSGIFNIEANA